jgi:alkylation response protein AidB-like acyl-CoA dehydrogenase
VAIALREFTPPDSEAAAMGVGIAQGAFDLALTYSKQRIQYPSISLILAFDSGKTKGPWNWW